MWTSALHALGFTNIFIGRRSAKTGTVDSARAFRLLLTELRVLREQVSELHTGLLGGASGKAQPTLTPASPHLAAGALYGTLLGSFRLYRAQAEVPLGGSRVVLDLCRYLVAHAGRVVPREVLLELLWPEQAPAAPATHRLHVAVSTLRHLLDEPLADHSLLLMEDEGYRIGADSVVTDCDLFELRYDHAKACLDRHNAPAAAESFRDALAVYGGEYLADSPYAEWALGQRAHFAERRLNALTALCEFATAEGSLLAVMEYAQAILAVDNLRERAHRQLMRAHYLMGQRSCAIRQFRVCADLLEQELGTAPSLQTKNLVEAIMNDAELPGEVPLFA